jgi:hypothetical protein
MGSAGSDATQVMNLLQKKIQFAAMQVGCGVAKLQRAGFGTVGV